MSRSGALALAAAAFLCAAGLALAEGLLFAAALPLAAWALLGLFREVEAPGLAAERRFSRNFARRGEGEGVEILITVRNLGRRIELLWLEDSLPEGCRVAGGKAGWAGSLEEGASIEFAYRVACLRGVWRFGKLSARAEDPFLALSAMAEVDCPGVLVVEPQALVSPSGLRFRASSARPFAGRSRAVRGGGGSDFAGTREYAPGDPLRSLNWRAESLWGESVVNVFEEEKAIDTGIILDARCEAYENGETFEAAVAAAASLAAGLLEGGNRVAFLSYGSTIEWTQGGLGREQALRLRMAFARASLGNNAVFERFDNLPVNLFPPRSSIVLVSPLVRGDLRALRSLVALGYSVSTLRPFERRPPPEGREEAIAARLLDLEYATLRAALLDSGIEVLDWDLAEPLPALAGRQGRLR